MKEKKFVEFIKLILENNYGGYLYMDYVEMTTDEAIEILRKSKNLFTSWLLPEVSEQ